MANRNFYHVPNARWASGLEKDFGQYLELLGIPYTYEKESFIYVRTVNKGVCRTCGGDDTGQRKIYTPDFFLPGDIIIETKGYLDATTRMRHRLIRDQHPGLDLRLVVSRDHHFSTKKKGKNGRVYYTEWAKEMDIPMAVFNPKKGLPSREWLLTSRWS